MEPANVRPEDARLAVREWLDSAAVGVRNAPVEGFTFNYVITAHSRTIAVGQLSANPQFLRITSSVNFTDDDNQMLEASTRGRASIIREIRIRLAACGTAFSGVTDPLEVVEVSKIVRLTEDFNAHEFFKAIDEIDAALVLLMAIVSPETDGPTELPNVQPPSNAPPR